MEEELTRTCPVTMREGSLRGGLECPKGWEQIVRKLARAVEVYAEKNKPELLIEQVKSKFGGLRFYTSEYDETVEALVREAEHESMRTCMECGRAGKPRGRGYIITVCDEHAA